MDYFATQFTIAIAIAIVVIIAMSSNVKWLLCLV